MAIKGIDLIVAVDSRRVVQLRVGDGVVSSTERSPDTPLTDVLSRFLADHGDKHRMRVLLLASDFFAQPVRLPTTQTRGLSQEELQSVLAFEVEPFSSISQDQARTAFVAGEVEGNIQVWQVLQLPLGEVQELHECCRAAKTKLMGIAHLEQGLHDLSDTELSEALGQMAAALMSSKATRPMIRPGRQAFSLKLCEWAALLIFALVCVGVVAHFLYLRIQHAKLQEQATVLGGMAAENSRIEQQNKRMNTEIETTLKQQMQRKKLTEDIHCYRFAWGALLEGLIASCADNVVIQDIQGEGFFEAKIAGVTTTEQGAGDFMQELGSRINQAGWQITLEQMQILTALGQGGVRRFSFKAMLEIPGLERTTMNRSRLHDEGYY